MGTFSKVYEALTTDKNFGTGFVNIKEYLFNTASREYQGLQQELVTNYGIISANSKLYDSDWTIIQLYLSNKYDIDIDLDELKAIVNIISNQNGLVVIGERQDMAGAYERYSTL
ncbi:hypothetical protein VMHJH2_05390 [Streptococcus uberis]|uniref:hypothetical protein n=1 Tax=Streptococcus uberis TaxID=1349 RepID=UPI0012B30ABE|nr:hypothetical protein [Streptococcus uberis]MCR4257954.1 hypothetical protein [Streptococcus uberis]MSU86547.1 hypothetical protein [Streptococcus dysgalactiae subsp. dysgalactiae]